MSRRWLLLFVPLVLVALGSAPYSSGESDSLYTDLGPVADFRFTDQEGRIVMRDDLRGKVWVASFFFSTCKECSKHQHNMAALQEQLAGWPDVMLVSFSVDPEKDTPQQMSRFAKAFAADPERWRFLTGPQADMYGLIKGSFYQAVEANPDPEPGAEYLHSFRFMVVDGDGNIRGYVDGKNSDEVARLGIRVKQLLQAKYLSTRPPQARYLPTVNAALNGLSGLLLVAGFLAIRFRLVRLHIGLMLSAVTVSAIFLGCYLYYHFVVLDGQPTRFIGEGAVRISYLTVLLSHTILAVAVTPLVLYTVWLGLRGKLPRHVAIAWWTFPLWLYVSVTGVVVYWMLYHLYPPV